MRYPAYPKYKASGVEWLGDVPEHWEVKRGRFCMRVNPRSARLRKLGPDDEVSFVPMEAVSEYGGLDLTLSRQIAEVGSGYTEFQDGDVVVAKITPCFENRKGALAKGLRNGAAFGTTELHVLRAFPNLMKEFLFYFTVSLCYREPGQALMYGAGGQKRVPSDFNKNLQVPIPPLKEQGCIASFLEKTTARLDELALKKRSLIENLKEKRIALITRAVTCGLPPKAARAAGLDPHPRLKATGIEWLSGVPEHWDLMQIKNIAVVRQGVTKGRDLGSRPTVELPYLRVANVQDGYLDLGRITTIAVLPSEVDRYSLKVGDVLMNEGGDNDKLGRGTIWKGEIEPCLHQNHVFAVRPHHTWASEWIALWTQATGAKCYFLTRGKQTTNLASISSTSIRELPVLLPPVREQFAIREFLDYETARIDQMISKVESAIELLKEYRSALITAAVTGKVDVRRIAP